MQTFVGRIGAIALLGVAAVAAASPALVSLETYLHDLSASFADPTAFRARAGATIFDAADATAGRTFGTPRILHVTPDGQRAVVLLSAAVAEDNSGDETGMSADWSGLYHVTRGASGWALADRIPLGVNRILDQRIAVAIDPATRLAASDRLQVEVAGNDGFPVLLNRAAQVTALTIDGKPATFDFQNGLLWIAAANGRHRIDLAYRLAVEHPAAGGNSAAFGPEAGHVRNQYYWHPFFGFNAERGRAPIFVHATIPARYRLALGITQSERVVDGMRIVEGHSAGPTDAISLAYDSAWQPRTLSVGGVTLNLFAAPGFTPPLETINAAFARAVRVLAARFGPPPVDTIAIIQGRARGRPGWHFFSNQGIYAGTQGGDPVRVTGYPTRVFLGHEVAHLWTHPTGWAHNFLGEGWATYAESLMLADEFGPDVERQFWRDQARLQRMNPAAMATAINDDPRNSGVAYAKGAWMLRMVERLVGRARFDQAMRGYVAASAQHASYEDFLAGFGPQHAQVEVFLAPWVSQKGLPEFAVAQLGGTLTITQAGPVYSLPALELRLTRRDGSTRIARVDIAGRTATVDLGGDDVTAVELDPFEAYLLDRRIFILGAAGKIAEPSFH